MSDGRRDLAARVLAALAASPREPLGSRELARTLGVPEDDQRSFRRLLQELEGRGQIRRVKGRRFTLGSARHVQTGTLAVTRQGDAFVRPDGSGPDVFVPGGRLAGAMDGDRVVVRIDRRPRGRSPEGVVLEVLERARSTVVGTFHRRRRTSFVVPLDRRLQREVLVPASGTSDDLQPRDGDVVQVRLVFESATSRPIGRVERVLGPLSDPGVDVLAVALGFELRLEFPPEVLEAAQEAAETWSAEPGPGRRDRTDLLCFTIDPADAKDHDDALSYTAREDGLAEVGIHIADVSHFVRAAGPVDAEAMARGTSVYLVDRAIPMLPPILSSDLCSLVVDEPRYAISLLLLLDAEGRVRERRYERTRIRCRRGLSYEEAQESLDGRRSLGAEIDAALRGLDDLARRIRERRRERGALELEIPEAKVVLDREGLPVDIRKRERWESHRLIEDFMILANEVVAADLEARSLPGLYRVHEPPTPEKAEELRDLLAPLGLNVQRRKTLKPKDIQKIIEAVEGSGHRELVSGLVLRTLAKARYDAENLGHFGLASPGYAHFTSPIRRYPDLVVHRAIAAAFLGDAPREPSDPEELQAVAAWASEREQAAEEAERATVALKKVEFMERHLGEVFPGRVSGVTPFGVFVTLEDYFVDGLVHVRTLEDDFYVLSSRDYALVGERRGRRFAFGDRLDVQVVRVDKEARQIDFLVVRRRSRVD
ncbi:MAG TPA: ribonuclease R [Longimicrobiales bacterium]|nr:ribonuclease R [Longimicrobiales bacterium]